LLLLLLLLSVKYPRRRLDRRRLFVIKDARQEVLPRYPFSCGGVVFFGPFGNVGRPQVAIGHQIFVLFLGGGPQVGLDPFAGVLVGQFAGPSFQKRLGVLFLQSRPGFLHLQVVMSGMQLLIQFFLIVAFIGHVIFIIGIISCGSVVRGRHGKLCTCSRAGDGSMVIIERRYAERLH
jgi:hypothetical protein